MALAALRPTDGGAGHMNSEPHSVGATPSTGAPAEPYGKLFRRFLRFGLFAWGGPVAQIDMIRQELVTEEKWVSPERFRRLLAIYQVLPGPEASELCVHFGMMSRGRIGGVLAGLGFMLPGFILMFILSWLYLSLNIAATAFQAVLLGIQPAVIALIVRACHRIGGHALVDRPLWVIALLAAAGQWLGVSFYLTLPLAGAAYACAANRHKLGLAVTAVGFAAAVAALSPAIKGEQRISAPAAAPLGSATARATGQATAPALFASGLRAGLLTFGGAYTAIPFLRDDAVARGAWMTEHDFLDGVALSGILPAPLIIFSTFVGYFGGGPLGALVMTFGVFLPAFLFSILFYRHLEAVIANPLLRHFLEGVTAGVVGLITVTTVSLAMIAMPNARAALIFAASLFLVYRWKSKLAVPAIMCGAGVAGWLLF